MPNEAAVKEVMARLPDNIRELGAINFDKTAAKIHAEINWWTIETISEALPEAIRRKINEQNR